MHTLRCRDSVGAGSKTLLTLLFFCGAEATASLVAASVTGAVLFLSYI